MRVEQDGQAPRGHVGELSTSALFMDKFLHKDASGPMSPYPWRVSCGDSDEKMQHAFSE